MNMNIRMIAKYYARQRRNRALVFSLIVHGIFVIVIGIWLLKPLIEKIEDNIAIDIIRPLEKIQVPKKQTVKEVEQPKTRKLTTASTTAPLKRPEAKRLPPSMSALPRVVKQPKFEPLPAATIADLTPEPETVLAPGTPDIDVARGSGEVVSGSGLARRREGSGVGNKPGTGRGGGGSGKGLGEVVKGGGTGRELGDGTDGDAFASVMEQLAKEIVESSGGGPIDIVFVVDTSGSMHDNIKSVISHLSDMVNVYKAAEVNYALGLTEFWADPDTPENKIKVVQLTERLKTYEAILRQIVETYQDENALDAVKRTIQDIRFRSNTKRHLILVTDEPFTSIEGVTLDNIISLCKEFDIHVNVLGLPITDHQRLAGETVGKLHLIPEDPQPQNTVVASTQTVGSNVIQSNVHNPVDIVLFIDTSKSMSDKLPNFLKELDTLVRDWDNAFIDYQMGVVRFRARGSVNIINTYDPPQTLEQVRKIATLPCEADETLLDAIVEGLQRLKFRPNALPHFILVTDEPAKGKHSPAAIIQMLQDKGVRVSVIGTVDNFQKRVAAETGGVWKAIPGGKKADRLYE